jgi:hypothetical protein
MIAQWIHLCIGYSDLNLDSGNFPGRSDKGETQNDEAEALSVGGRELLHTTRPSGPFTPPETCFFLR